MSEMNMLDNMVEQYGMNVYLCTHASRHTPKGESVSDVMFSTWDQFVVKGMANKDFGMSYAEIEMWGPRECGTFYRENLIDTDGSLKLAHMGNISNNRALSNAQAGFTNYAREAWTWRFTNGYAFGTYRTRVDRFLQLKIERHTQEGMQIVKQMNAALASVESLREEAEELFRNSVPTNRLKKLVHHVLDNLKVSDVVELDLIED